MRDALSNYLLNDYACKDCRWWVRKDATERSQGTCRRRTPRVDVRTGLGYWPITLADAWCAEFHGFPVQMTIVETREPQEP